MSIIRLVISNQPNEITPFCFFDSFYKPGVIGRTKEAFFQALRPDEFDSSYLYSENQVDDYVEIEYTREEYEPGNEFETYKSQQVTKRYIFSEELNKYLRDQFFILKGLLDIRLNGNYLPDVIRLFVANELTKLVHHIEFISDDSTFSAYREVVQRPVYATIRYLFRNYPLLVPPASSVISEALKDDYLIDYNDSMPELKISLANAIIELEDSYGESFFFKDIDSSELIRTRELLIALISGELPNDSKITVTKNIQAFYYLVSKLNELRPYTLKSIEQSELIILNKIKFKAASCSKAVSNLKKQESKLISTIDLLFTKHSK